MATKDEMERIQGINARKPRKRAKHNINQAFIDQETEEFLRKGGTIKHITTEDIKKHYYESDQWNKCPVTPTDIENLSSFLNPPATCIQAMI